MAKKEARGFTYQSRSRDDVKRRADMKGGNFDTIFKPQFKSWKPKEGKNRIRILPPTWKGAKHYGLDIYVNYSIGPDKQSYLSLSKHNKGDDPLAEARREAQREGDKEYAKALNPSQRILYWIIDRMDEEEGPQLWAAPFTFDKNLANMCIDEDTKDVIEVDSPTDGRDIRFYREGSGLNTDYPPAKMKLLEASPIHDDEGQENEWLDFVAENPLPDVLNFYPYDHIKAQFDGQSARPDEDDEKPSKTKPAKDEDDDEAPPPRSRQRAKPTDDDDDEDAEEKPSRRVARKPEPEEDDEPEEKPARRVRSRVPVDDEEDESVRPTRSPRGKTEPEDDDEDEPEEKPARSGSLREKLAARRKSRPSDEDDD